MLAKGKYVFNDSTLHVQNSERFYFETDLLEEKKEADNTYDDMYIAGDNSIKFKVKNYADELRVNNLKIEYQVNVEVETAGVTVTTYINGEEKSTGEINPNVKKDDEIKIQVNENITSTVKLKISVTSTSPYTKTLEKKFNVMKTENTDNYELNLVQDANSDYAKLYIKTNNFSGRLKVEYDLNKTVPDSTCELLKEISIAEIESGTFYIDLNQKSNYEIDFVKRDKTRQLVMGSNISSCDIVVGR